MTPDAGWTEWAEIQLQLTPPVLAETLDGGQAFRWARHPDGSWRGTWAACTARLSLDAGEAARPGADAGDRLRWSAPTELAAVVAADLPRHLALDLDFAALADALPWRTDAHLARCLAAFPGLRILRQPFGETLLGFLCSATKRIVQIKQMVGLLADRHGAALTGTPGHGRRLPTWTELAALSEADLRRCQLGFRARHVHGTARFLAKRPGWLEATEQSPYAEAKARLLELPGVGEKVADCVLLFGAGRLEAFPVDTWILRAMATRYGLGGWKPAQVAHFGRVHFGPLAGLAQQYLFAQARAEAAEATRAG
jgi:N-glycosylase/DNA lyase